MKTSCPHCGQRYEVEAEAVGSEAECVKCGKIFPVTAPPNLKPIEEAKVAHCPYCGGEISLGVKKCRHCGEWIAREAKPLSSAVYVVLALFFGILGVHNFAARQLLVGFWKVTLSVLFIPMLLANFPIGLLCYALIVLWCILDIIIFCSKGR